MGDDEKEIVNYDNLTFAGVKSLINEEINSNEGHKKILKPLLNAMESVQSIPIVTFNKSLYILSCDSPSLSSKEIEYYKKDNNFSEYLLRYDGKIKPNFINPSNQKYNYIYGKYYTSKDNLKKSFSKYLNTGYSPKFPSIDYYSLISSKLMGYGSDDYTNFQNQFKNSEDSNIKDLPDIKWFNNSKILILKSFFSTKINITDVNNDGTISLNELNKGIEEMVKNYYNLDDYTTSYVVSQYDITYDLQETSFEDNTTIFKYIVNFNLK